MAASWYQNMRRKGLALLALSLVGSIMGSLTFSMIAEAASLTLNKSWVNSLEGHQVTIPATTGGTNNTTALVSVSASGGGNTTPGVPVTISPGDTLTFGAETFDAGNSANYSVVLACTGNSNPLSGADGKVANTLLIGGEDEAIVCTYTNIYSAPTTGPPFSNCDGYGVLAQPDSLNTTPLKFVNVANGTTTAGPTVPTQINAIGYNDLDNYMYASDISHREFVKIDANGGVTPLGVPAGLTPKHGGANPRGTVHNGIYYGVPNPGPGNAFVEGYAIDLSTMSLVAGPTPVTMGSFSQSQIGVALGFDIVYVNGRLYNVGYIRDPDNIARLHLVSLDASSFVGTDHGEVIGNGLPTSTQNIFGASYTDTAGNFFAQDNFDGKIWRFNTTNLAGTISATPGPPPFIGNNDGTRCASSIFRDYGDAPASYGSASHIIGGYDPVGHTSYLMIGSSLDGELSQPFTANADGDNLVEINDEATLANNMSIDLGAAALGSAGGKVNIPVQYANSSGSSANIAAWIDFNRSGSFDDGERSDISTVADGSTGATLAWTIPADAKAGSSYMRLRIFGSTITNPSPTETMDLGEVEDYRVNITSSITPPNTGLAPKSPVVFIALLTAGAVWFGADREGRRRSGRLNGRFNGRKKGIAKTG